MTNESLVEIRCPLKRMNKKTNKEEICNLLIIKVAPGSSGEGYCSIHKQSFSFDVGGDNLRRKLNLNIER